MTVSHCLCIHFKNYVGRHATYELPSCIIIYHFTRIIHLLERDIKIGVKKGNYDTASTLVYVHGSQIGSFQIRKLTFLQFLVAAIAMEALKGALLKGGHIIATMLLVFLRYR